MVINKKVSKKQKFVEVLFVRTVAIGTDFAGAVFDFFYNFIIFYHWIINNTSQIFNI